MFALQRPYNVHTIGPRFGTPWVAKPRSEFACQNRGPYIHIAYKIVNLHNIVCTDRDFARTAVLQPTHVLAYTALRAVSEDGAEDGVRTHPPAVSETVSCMLSAFTTGSGGLKCRWPAVGAVSYRVTS